MLESSAIMVDISNIAKMLYLINYYNWSFIKAIVGEITKTILPVTLEIA